MNEIVSDQELYRIGAVSRLTGIPVDTLRVWERRYSVVKPQRSEGGNRLYSREDVDRLRLIRQLVNRSHAIGTICNLNSTQLRQRLDASLQSDADLGRTIAVDTSRPISVVLVGATLGLKLRNALSTGFDDALDVVGEFGDLAAMANAADGIASEAAIVDIDSLRSAESEALLKLRDALPDCVLVVVYGFAPKATIEPLGQAGVLIARHPVDWPSLIGGIRARLTAGALTDRDGDDLRQLPTRIFTDRELAAISGMSVTLKCECPHHLSELIGSLASFEKYSAQCESESDEDAALHAYLRHRSAQARLLMERALQRVMQREGLTLPDAD